MYALTTGQRSLRGTIRLAAALTVLLLLASLTVLTSPALATEPTQASGSADCVDSASLSDTELRDRLLAAGSHVADPQDASGSEATAWSATIVVPDDLCDAVVSFSSYLLPSGFVQPYENQELFDNVTGTYVPGIYEVSVELPHPCGWQVDLYVGTVLFPLIPGVGHPGNRQIDVSANETQQPCVEEPPVPGTLEVRKETSPGGSSESFAFTSSFTTEGFSLSDGESLAPVELSGAQSVSEGITDAQEAAGWALSALNCTGDDDFSADGATVNVTVDPGETIVCTFTNTQTPPEPDAPPSEEPESVAPPSEEPESVAPPREDTAGGSGGPSPALPDTAMDGPAVPSPMAAIFAALIALSSMGLLVHANLRAARQRR